MAKRSQMYQKLPWNGGVNDSVDPGVLNDNDLVTADNVVFATSGSRLKREGLSYLDTTIPTPDLKTSSGASKTIKWTTNSIKQSSGSTDEILVDQEYFTVTGDTNYTKTEFQGTITHTAQVATVLCTAPGTITDTSYFYIDGAEGGTSYYVWMDKTGSSTDPAVSGRTGVQVDISAAATAGDVATAVASALTALSEFSASSGGGATVTVTWATAGIATNPSDAGSTGFTITTTTEGSSNLTYTQSDNSDDETDAAATDLTVARAEDVLCITDYWRTDSSNVQQQRLVSHTNYGKMFYYDGSNNRIEIPGQPEVSTVVCGTAASITENDFFVIYSANDATEYKVWYDKGTGSAPAGGTPVQVDISGSTTADDVATETKTALDGITGTPFVTTRDSATLTITNSTAGATTDIADGSAATGFTFTTTTQGATLPTTAVSQIRSIVFNNKLIHCYTGIGNLPTKYRPEDSANYQKLLNAPDAAFMTNFLSRLWCNDKTDPHRLHYSTTANEEEWNGTGDSGAIDIYPGDGDPVGITAIYTYKGALFVAKKTKIYRILGDSPENFQVVPISGNLGSEGSMVVNIEQDDAVFVSERGLHSAQATDQFGDVSSKFLSAKIQTTFNTWTRGSLDNIQGVWIPTLNSVFFAVPASGSTNNELWALNTEVGGWYRWPSISCQALSKRLVGNNPKLVTGTTDGRIIQAQNGDYTDFNTTAYSYKIKTGRIYPGGNPQTMKGFKRIGFFYKPVGDFQFTVRIKIDNGATQALTFEQESTTELLGVDFVLGQSILGFSDVLAPYMQTIDGYGRGLTIEIEQASLNQQVEIYGYIIEYEDEQYRQEVQND